MITPADDFGNWKRGNNGGEVVTDKPLGEPSEETVNYYGGYLVAESIQSPRCMALILAAPKMLRLLKELIDIEGPQPGHVEWMRKVQTVIGEVA